MALDGACVMAKGKAASRVNGRNGENMYVEGDELCFKTKGEVCRMPLEVLTSIEIANAEQAREAVKGEDLVPYGAWCEEMPAVGGKSVFVLARGRASLWVMEITKNQVPNASSFVNDINPNSDEDDSLRIPNRVINTPLGGLFTVGSIVCILLAIFCVFSWNQPVIGLILAVAAIIMYLRIK